jgi:hypothetical protein
MTTTRNSSTSAENEHQADPAPCRRPARH